MRATMRLVHFFFFVGMLVLMPAAQAQNQAFDPAALLGNWELLRTTDAEGNRLDKDGDGERDRFSFHSDHSVGVVKKGAQAKGFFKFSPSSGSLVITDQERKDNVMYTVLELNGESLVLLYPDEKRGIRKLYFQPLR
jgi:hypothetical protein